MSTDRSFRKSFESMNKCVTIFLGTNFIVFLKRTFYLNKKIFEFAVDL